VRLGFAQLGLLARVPLSLAHPLGRDGRSASWSRFGCVLRASATLASSGYGGRFREEGMAQGMESRIRMEGATFHDGAVLIRKRIR